MGKLEELPHKDELIQWLIERQITGFEGRVQKPPDGCYAFWIGGSLKMLGAWDLVDFGYLRSFLCDCQGHLTGGFAKYSGYHPDVLHTYYALCGLSFGGEQGLLEIEPTLGLTKRASIQVEKKRNQKK